MVRVITQETFNDGVKQNMDDFEMSLAEAVEETVHQFQAQGVDLTNIVIGAELNPEKDPTILCIKRLAANKYEENTESLSQDLKYISNECNKELAKKLLVGKEGGYETFLNLFEFYKDNNEIQVLILQCLISLMSGYPDLLDEKGIQLMSSILSKSKDEDIIQHTLRWCKECCVKHEKNRQAIFNSYVIEVIPKLLDSDAVKETCGLVRSLCLDDDIRVEISQAHEHARTLAVNLICPINSLILKHKNKIEDLTDILLTLSVLIVRNEFCAKVDDAGILNLITGTISNHYTNEKLMRVIFILLKKLAGNDDVKAHIFQKETLVSLIMHALEVHVAKPAVAEAGIGLVAVLALRSPSNSQYLCNLNVNETIVTAMKIHSADFKTQRVCCWAVRNIVSRRKDLNVEFLKLGIEELLINITKNHKVCNDDAKAALRDLGCDVKLIESWTGKGVSMKNE